MRDVAHIPPAISFEQGLHGLQRRHGVALCLDMPDGIRRTCFEDEVIIDISHIGAVLFVYALGLLDVTDHPDGVGSPHALGHLCFDLLLTRLWLRRAGCNGKNKQSGDGSGTPRAVGFG